MGNQPNCNEDKRGFRWSLHGFTRWQLALIEMLERRIGDVNGIKEAFGPCLRFRGFKNYRLTFLPNEDCGRQVNALG